MKSNLLVIAKRQRNGDRSKANSALDGAFFLSVNNVNTSIAENSIDMIFRFKLLPVYRLTFVSPSCQRITGYTPEEYYADPELIRKTVHPEDWNLLQEFINPVNACNRNSTILRWLRKDGSVIWTEQSLTFIHDERGEPTEAYIIARDISERKMAEEALRASEEKFSKVFNSSLNAICIVTVEGETILDINDSFTKFTGYTREEIIGHHAAELNIWVNKEEPARLLETLIENGRLYNFEINSRMKSGEVRTVLLSAEIINIAGKPCMILVITDITEQKRAEDALKENEEFTASLLMNTPTPIFVTYPDTSIKYANPAFEKLTGYSLNDISGMKSPYPWWPEETRHEIQARLKNSTFGDGVKKEMAYRKKNGEPFWVELNATVIHQNGEKRYIVVAWVDITERKQMEMALRESEEKFSKAFNASPSIMSITTPDGKYVEVNESFLRISGLSREEAIGRSSSELNIWANPEEHIRFVERIKEQGHIYNEEFRFRGKTGDIQTVLFSAEQINIGGEPCLISVSNDISERKHAEKSLKESEEKFSKAFSAASDAMAIFASDGGKFVEVNDSYIRLSGYSRDELIGYNADDLNMWGNAADRERILKLTLETGRVVHEEFDFRKKSGEIRTCLFSAESMTVSGERRMITIIQDITERKQAEAALRESEYKFRNLFEHARDAVFLADADTGILSDANPAGCAMLGWPKDQIVGKHMTILHPPEMAEKFTQIFSKHVKKGIVPPDDSIIQHADGRRIPATVSASVIRLADKTIIQGVFRDVSEHKKAEEALRDSEEKFSKAFTASANAICITSLEDNKFIEVNESYSRFTGYTREEVIGRTATELNLWVYQEELEEFQRKVEEEGNLHNLEIHSRKKSGEIRVGLASAEVINISGKPCRIVVITDITERKQVEEALKESEEKFSKVFSASANAISIASGKENRFVDINESFSRFTGYTREEVIGHNANELGLWANEEEMKRSLDTLQKEGRVYNQEFRSRMKSGEIKVGLSSVETINIKGEPCRIVVITDITERKKAERALLESEEKFSKAFLASPDAIAISTVKDGRFIDINESFVRMMGYTRAESIGHTSFELNLWPDEENRNKLIDVLRNQGSIHNELFNFRKKSGEIGLGLFSAEPIVIGNEPCMISVNVNVTQQKKAEEHLRLLGSVTQQVTDSTIVTDPDFKITYMNKAAQELFGFSTDEALGTDISFLDVAPLSKSTQREMRDTLASGKTWTAIIPKQRKDGSIFLCDCKRCPMYDENGRLSSYIIVHHDITEQKEFEEKLKAHKQLIESILTSMPEGVLVTDKSDQIILANEAFRRILHTGRKVIENRPLDEIIHVEQLLNLYRSMKAGNTLNTSLEFRYKVRNQEKIIDCVIIRMGGDRMLLTFTDVSRGREEEDKLYLMDRLASLGEMAAGLAHELNNPLTGILTLSQLLVNSDLPREQKEDIQCVYSEAKRAASIVKNVLLFTRNNNYENGQSSVNEVVKEVLRLREHEESINNISVVTNLQEYLPEILLDKYQLQQVFLNIILNAEAAMKETNRPGILTVTTERVNNHVNIIFTDNGNGIKKHILPRIFDPFFTTKDIGKGTGLGLSICYGIIVKHGGKISVKTQVGEGTTFTIRMPVINTEKRD
jgi:PAS domain S-box-containing protein